MPRSCPIVLEEVGFGVSGIIISEHEEIYEISENQLALSRDALYGDGDGDGDGGIQMTKRTKEREKASRPGQLIHRDLVSSSRTIGQDRGTSVLYFMMSIHCFPQSPFPLKN